MCVALPGTVISCDGDSAVVDFSGNRVRAKTGLVDVAPGDKVLVHAGCVLQKMREEEAVELERLFKELGDVG
ncbi:MAG: HypC/HybG/HupF family hydrogenase formation chaperone [Eubacteriaceae bacterium]|jgi:hydrogenase expression/formation protein HypC|uniref:HypC/HybG/HupF family hydrogenase formation chaperone n=1 Tax=Candidatus Pseudoramibacter fermentans TaxID=2594427 RepID=A0A6L5GPQ8_9FIRM|nr:HypC/HybG/HupF family hydrogenase formation chaperone [Candidatus Pseudoramibacter fermentans]RRF92027.1 MAG: HypC/HybG/HupF family hydrogenase formation chaperone [Eubacteriaceae bacterium]